MYTSEYKSKTLQELSWPWSCGSWIYNYLSPLMLWVRIRIKARCTTLCDQVCQWLATGRWFSPGPPVSSINKTDRHDMNEILLKVALNTIKQTIQNLTCHKGQIVLSMMMIMATLPWRTVLTLSNNFIYFEIPSAIYQINIC